MALESTPTIARVTVGFDQPTGRPATGDDGRCLAETENPLFGAKCPLLGQSGLSPPPSVPTVWGVAGLLTKLPCDSDSCLQIIWARPDVCRLLAINLGCWQNNVGSRPPILSVNLGRKSGCLQAQRSMFAGRYS